MNYSSIHELFPILKQTINGKPLIYFDNGATTQKPQQVIDAVTQYYTLYNSNIHRGVHYLSQIATEKYEETRIKAQQFLNASKPSEIIFTKGTTDGINLIAHGLAKKYIKTGDEIIISYMEHHSNIVPWQMLCEYTGATLKVIPMFPDGSLDMESYKKLLSPKTKLVSVNHISNTLGTINPVEKIIQLAHQYNALVLIDGAQAVSHFPVNVQSLNADFYVFSGHKLYAPTGIGILYGKEHLLNELPPYQGGGDMIKNVTFEKTTYNDLPLKFEAGTPNIAGGIGLGAAFDFIKTTSWESVQQHEYQLLEYFTKQLKEIPGVKIFGEAQNKVCILSFLIEGIHPYDLGTLLDQFGIAVRTGHHCTQPIMDFYNIPGTVRASLSIYNQKHEIDSFIEYLKQSIRMLQ